MSELSPVTSERNKCKDTLCLGTSQTAWKKSPESFLAAEAKSYLEVLGGITEGSMGYLGLVINDHSIPNR